MTPVLPKSFPPGWASLHGVPEGYDALVVAALADRQRGRVLVHVARDDLRLSRIDGALDFFAPQVRCLRLPAWDCLPYDRVSPNAEVTSQRVDTLGRLADGVAGDGPVVLLTTANAVVQRLPVPDFFRERMIRIGRGERIAPEALIERLVATGHGRTGTVREPGEFAQRGGILDVFPNGAAEPLRLDFFGDEVESIRRFDAASQRTIGDADALIVRPVSEVLLEEDAIGRFRRGFRELFGARGQSDPLYESVSAGRRIAGMEHWLPLFHERLATLFDYLDEPLVTCDARVREVIGSRHEQIREHYDARKRFAESRVAEAGGPYLPVPPERLYLFGDDWVELTEIRPWVIFDSFAAPSPSFPDCGARLVETFAEARTDPNRDPYREVWVRAAAARTEERRFVVAAHSFGSRERLANLLKEKGEGRLLGRDAWEQVERTPPEQPTAVVLPLERGFVAPGLEVVAEADIVGERLVQTRRQKRRGDAFLAEVSALAEGDLVVHVDHGLGRYLGLETVAVGGARHDCLAIGYAGNDKLLVPVENIDVLSRYGPAEGEAALDKLGGAAWQARRARVKKKLRDIADSLIAVAAERLLKPGESVSPPEGAFDEFCARFPYAETDDQLTAIQDVLQDLGSGRPMDRLICGDVGFGKTEVALRAAFVCAMSGMQVAVVVPTTLLARQHYETFVQRFRGLPVRIAQLSRLVPAATATRVRKELADGDVNIVVGTHALLGKAIRFSHLGLVVVDEEQRFGVAHKERLKTLRTDVHMLTLSATPIPRTLQLALSGVREMTLIATPPVDRLAVRTFVMPFDGMIVREAILREQHRGGQVFYVCPRIEDLATVADRLRSLVPEIRFVTAHGQMPARDLEEVMTAFTERRYDLLLATNIIESGLDIAAANTLIVHRSDRFGLGQLYQLRGRVGRGKVRAYAYLTLPPGKVLSNTSRRRLEVMQTLDSLGAGFSLASHDLDIRGAGNLLGEEQSGHVREVGVELYQRMLEEAVAEARSGDGGAEEPTGWTPHINLGLSVLIPEEYVADLGVRLSLYRRLVELEDRPSIESFAAELIDRFGSLPDEVETLLETMAIKRACRDAGIDKVDAGPKGVILGFHGDRFANPDGLIRFVAAQAGTVKLRPDHRIVYQRDWRDDHQRLKGVSRVVHQIAAIAREAEAA